MTAAELIAEAMGESESFGHREHVRLSWLAVRRHPVEDAVVIVSDTLRETARYAGVPQKYHATASRAWVELIAVCVVGHPDVDFEVFIDSCPQLLDKRLLRRFYSSHALASAEARSGWVEPDLALFPSDAGAFAGERDGTTIPAW